MSIPFKIDKIICSKRRTVALKITEDAQLIIKAPLFVHDEILKQFIVKHQKWIIKKLNETTERREKVVQKKFVNGEEFSYLGQLFKLHITDCIQEPFVFDNGFYVSKEYEAQIKDLFIQWYKREAHRKIVERVEYYAKKWGFKYRKIRITAALTRWGSCTLNGNLNFSYRLIMAPIEVVDYVVVHELAHLVEHNHSPKFWKLVETIIPEYKKMKKWLKENGYFLRFD